MTPPDVYRNARYEHRLAVLEVLATGLFESMAAMAVALAQLNELVNLRMMVADIPDPQDRMTH